LDAAGAAVLAQANLRANIAAQRGNALFGSKIRTSSE
jgi:hypothetical protein